MKGALVCWAGVAFHTFKAELPGMDFTYKGRLTTTIPQEPSKYVRGGLPLSHMKPFFILLLEMGLFVAHSQCTNPCKSESLAVALTS